MAVTIRDVAARAGVSQATASRAMTGIGSVDPTTAARVRDAAARLGYERNPWASSLRGGTTRKLAMIVPDLMNPFFAELVRSAQGYAHELGYLVLVAETDDDPAAELELLRSLADRVDGNLVCTPQSPQEVQSRFADESPTVFLHRVSATTPYVISDIDLGVRLAVENLIALGHRRIAYLDGPAESWSAGLRRAAVAAVGDEHPDVEIVPVGQVRARFEGGVAGGDLVIASGASAVLAYNDVVALGLMHRLARRGLVVPDDISVVGFDDVPAAAMASPGLTTVAQPLAESARAAVDMLLAVASGAQPSSKALVLAPTLVVRESTAPPASAVTP